MDIVDSYRLRIVGCLFSNSRLTALLLHAGVIHDASKMFIKQEHLTTSFGKYLFGRRFEI